VCRQEIACLHTGIGPGSARRGRTEQDVAELNTKNKPHVNERRGIFFSEFAAVARLNNGLVDCASQTDE